FGPPAAKPEAAPAAAPKSNLDDLFGPPAAKPEAAPAKPAANADPFSSVPLEPAELSMRTWVDNTGKFQVTAKLVAILDGQVRLLKDTGKTTTVVMDRLSDADQQYVQDVAGHFGSAVIGQVAAR
ncbi:MAG: cytoskeleton assembly control protein, partial [Candidatus Anammoximicrobium sp.]|nr:cytoskeleton assembly control protein [Candidatus Anammoximicrobium sp.]